MKIGGFQRFSLLDYPGQLAAIVFTQGCNFRCPYCHNPELVDPERFRSTWETARILSFLKRRRGKLSAVVITGGEPTYQPNLIKFVRQIKDMGYLVKMDTNGSAPQVIQALIDKELVDYWAMDIKAPIELYSLISRSAVPVNNILESMQILRDSGQAYEFRTTFFESLFTWDDILNIQELLRPGDRYYLQECRYTGTLEDISGSNGITGFKHLSEVPACQTLLRWGDEHHISIHIRSL